VQIISLFSFLLVARVCIQGFIFGLIIDCGQFPSSLVVVLGRLFMCVCVWVLKNGRVGCSLCSSFAFCKSARRMSVCGLGRGK
jgi:hypothetical protein